MGVASCIDLARRPYLDLMAANTVQDSPIVSGLAPG